MPVTVGATGRRGLPHLANENNSQIQVENGLSLKFLSSRWI
jgi:hypothetical protein